MRMKIPAQIGLWVLTVGLAAATDPLLLEYSDYYYDLYYGDYDDYSPVEEVHSTAPRSIRVEKPVNLKDDQDVGRPIRSNRRGNRAKLAENEPDHHQIQHVRPPPPPPQVEQAPVIEPLNVRLQRLLSHDQSSAQTILDILEAPRQSQEEIIKFLRHVVDRIQEEERSSNNNFQSNQRQQQQSRPAERPSPPPSRPPPQTRPPPPPPTRPPPQTRPPPPPPTRPPPPPPTRPPPPPPTRPPPPPTRPPTRQPPPPPPKTAPPPTFRPQDFREPKSSRVDSEIPKTAHQTVNSQFSQFPNFQTHLQSNRDGDQQEIPRQSQQERDDPRNNFHVSKFEEKEQERSFRNQNHQDFRNQNQPVRVQQIQKENRNSAKNLDNDRSKESSHSPTSSSGLTIEEFLSRYPEVKRLSSRFGDDNAPNTEAPFKSHKKQKFSRNNKGKNKKSHNNNHNGNKSPGQHSNFIPFNVPDTTPATAPPRITPRQRQTELPPPPPTRRPPPPPQTTQPPPPPPPTQRPTHKQHQQKKNKKNKSNKNKQQKFNIQEQPQTDQLASYDDYGIDNLDYDYYYDQLVPEHERFFQLPKTESATPDPIVEQNENQPGSFQVFTHFTNDNGQSVNKIEVPPPPKKKHKPKPKSIGGGSKANSVGPPLNKPGGPQAGPFGYTDKGTYFEDSHFDGFPERIEMIYQGFVWAMDMFYPGQDSVLHGGVHTILKDKVKQETVNLEGDYIVRVSGRASPYNINRLTFYTKNGQKFGPWGDRHSDDSVDFDVSAPPGQALAFFSGTIDFGVPLRSVSFHWRPIS